MLQAANLDRKASFAAFLPQSYPQNALDLSSLEDVHSSRQEIANALGLALPGFTALTQLA
ncbi:hypothetical protein AA23498_2582 [Acetobacter nitrogenifigens DSM 23921 = NBRC 105050]|uniref:Uncharacterized protein n=1 Tax=Acetobacter nitrogenifigens DSM 23921 = NBRC 105050 TaxID=1120919 RepID=A0A511X628_9PROT|nr:hypothetical protein [Acetobacter nitrogenifigens]GBQ96227.1 hypothetical protein AA23498_2582 [Acetobacter nitrogenifigens DSM 23921 = NBRC 105050]GEN58401.1 hypothetical protein ANI02nite_02850 [Acetobacter nitrogenifigens DSM 23921 = NBRC 105050]